MSSQYRYNVSAEARAKGYMTNMETHSMQQRMTWDQICEDDHLRGRWIAIDDCSFDESTGKATEGLVIDCDDDLAELCARIRESEHTNCSILFADSSASKAPCKRPLSN